MKRLVIAALALVAVGVVASSALAATRSSVIYDSTNPNGPPSNMPSYGPEAYAFNTIGDKITFAGTARNLTNATVTMSSWACQNGASWNSQSCVTTPGATFSQPITLTIFDDHHHQLATSTQTFAIPYRPSASPKCITIDAGSRPGGWYQPSSKSCKNGLADDVTFNFSGVKLPNTVVYEISYNTNTHGPNPLGYASPADSLNVAITDQPSAGTQDGMTVSPNIWPDGYFAGETPAVQFKAGNAS